MIAFSNRFETNVDSLWIRSLVVVLGVIMLAMVSAAVAQPVHAQNGPCRSVMEEMLAEGGVTSGDTMSVEYDVSTGGHGTGPIHMGWTRLNSCRGYLVTQTTEYCMALQRFTLGACAAASTLQSRAPNKGS